MIFRWSLLWFRLLVCYNIVCPCSLLNRHAVSGSGYFKLQLKDGYLFVYLFVLLLNSVLQTKFRKFSESDFGIRRPYLYPHPYLMFVSISYFTHLPEFLLVELSTVSSYIQHCMDLQLAVDPYKRCVLFESMDWLPKTYKVIWHISANQISPNIH